jgi:ribosomal protein S21
MPLSPRKDLPAVEVYDGDLSRALKRFHSLWENCGITRELKFREKYPSRAARRKAKAATAMRRFAKKHAG